jgi:hypothetical protein
MPKQLAIDFRVSPALHPEDNILWFLFGHPRFQEPREAIRFYFDSTSIPASFGKAYFLDSDGACSGATAHSAVAAKAGIDSPFC